jgi:hypothetical protein
MCVIRLCDHAGTRREGATTSRRRFAGSRRRPAAITSASTLVGDGARRTPVVARILYAKRHDLRIHDARHRSRCRLAHDEIAHQLAAAAADLRRRWRHARSDRPCARNLAVADLPPQPLSQRQYPICRRDAALIVLGRRAVAQPRLSRATRQAEGVSDGVARRSGRVGHRFPNCQRPGRQGEDGIPPHVAPALGQLLRPGARV